jgi:hypothetical protein
MIHDDGDAWSVHLRFSCGHVSIVCFSHSVHTVVTGSPISYNHLKQDVAAIWEDAPSRTCRCRHLDPPPQPWCLQERRPGVVAQLSIGLFMLSGSPELGRLAEGTPPPLVMLNSINPLLVCTRIHPWQRMNLGTTLILNLDEDWCLFLCGLLICMVNELSSIYVSRTNACYQHIELKMNGVLISHR